ncbi:MAG: hypothetical protein WDN04_07415 [Rhodospirillales bacterium]
MLALLTSAALTPPARAALPRYPNAHGGQIVFVADGNRGGRAQWRGGGTS